MTSKLAQMVAYMILLLALACQKEDTPTATEPANPEMFPVTRGIVDEASGIQDSRRNTGFLWVHQDSDTPPDLALLSHKGVFSKKIYIKDARNRDWEDMAMGKGPDAGKDYLYVADTGDNFLRFGTYFIWRFPEPAANEDTVYNAEKISFKYPDGSHDAEAFVIEPETMDIYIITKRENQSSIYLLKYPYGTTETHLLTFVGKLPYNDVVGAAIQPDQRGLIIKTYNNLNYYPRNPGERIGDVLKKQFSQLKYDMEIQGEAVTFSNDGKGYFTLGERRLVDVTLNYYRK